MYTAQPHPIPTPTAPQLRGSKELVKNVPSLPMSADPVGVRSNQDCGYQELEKAGKSYNPHLWPELDPHPMSEHLRLAEHRKTASSGFQPH